MSDDIPESIEESVEGDDEEPMPESPGVSSPPSSTQPVVSSSPPSPQVSQDDGSDIQSLVMQTDDESTSSEPVSPEYATSPRDVTSPDGEVTSPGRDVSSPTDINDEADYDVSFAEEEEEIHQEQESSQGVHHEQESSQDGHQDAEIRDIPVEYGEIIPSQNSEIELNPSEQDIELEQSAVVESRQDDEQVLESQERLEPSSEYADPDDVSLRTEQLARQLQRREEELERLTAENRTLSNQLSSAINAKCEAILQVQQVATKEWQLQHKEKSLEQQMEILQAHNKQISSQLQEQGLELADVRHNSETRIMRLERQLNLKTDELRESEESAARQNERLLEEQRRVEALLDKLREARDSEINLQEVHSQEIQGQTRLAQLYQEESIESRALAEQLSAAVCELREALQEASQKYGDLETNAEKDKIKLQKQLELRNKTIEALKQELKNANVLLEESAQGSAEKEATITSLAPAAAAARKLVQSGMTLTQVYSQYAHISEELETKSAENLHLRESLNSIVKQLEDKAPQLAADHEILKRTQQENERLLSDHDSIVRQCEVIKEEAQQERRRACKLDRENGRLQTLINDLSKQVIVLVREVDALKHRSFAPPLNLSNSYEDHAGLNASQVLTERLVPFRDVDELQTRNLELLALVRELSDKAEAQERAELEGKDLVTLTSKLDEALQQLSDLQERESQHSRLMEQLIQQRDHYRELTLQSGTNTKPTHEVALSPMKFDPSSPMKKMSMPGPEEIELRSKLKSAEESLAITTKQLEQLRHDATTRAAQLASQMEKMREEANESSVSKAKLVAICEHKTEKLASALIKVEDLTKTLETETKKCTAKTKENEKYYKITQDLQSETITLKSQLAHCQVNLSSLQSELDRYRFIEMSLKQQCQNLEKSLADRASVCASIDEMKILFERSNANSNAILIRQLDEARLENRGLATRLQEETARLGSELGQLQAALETERANVRLAEEGTLRAETEVARAAERLAQAERDVLALRAHRNPCVDTAAQTELCVSEEVLREKRTTQRALELEQQVTQLRSELSRAEARVAQLSSIVDASESALQQANSAAEQANAEAQQRLSEVENGAAELLQKVNALETELVSVRQQKEMSENASSEQLASLRIQLEEAATAAQRATDAEGACQALQSALEAAESEVRSTAETLALEVQKHVQVTQLNDTLRDQLTTQQDACKKLEMDLESSKQALAAAEVRLSERETELGHEAEGREREVKELQEQNKALLDQVQLMGAELCALKQQQPGGSAETDANTSNLDLSSSFAEESASAEQLLQVLRYLRVEKNTAISSAEVLREENTKLKAQLDSLQKQLVSAVHHAGELDANAPEAVTRERYGELLRRLEVLSVLSESSLRQREAASSLRVENEELRTRNSALSQQLEAGSAELRKTMEQIEALQVELTSVRGEANRWRSCANQMTERASRANPEELKKLLQERENLQRQLASEREELRKLRLVNASERENLQRQLATEREELRKSRIVVTERENELSQTQGQLTSLQTEHDTLNTTLTTREQELSELRTKDFQIRRIAKKYKGQFEELSKNVEEEKAAQTKEGQNLAETEARASSAETKASQLQEQLTQTENKIKELEQQLEAKDKEMEALQKEQVSTSEKSDRIKQVLNNARLKLNQLNADLSTQKKEKDTIQQNYNKLQLNYAELQTKVNSLEQAKEEESVRKAALTTQFEGKVARLERELSEVRQQQQQQPPARQEKPQQMPIKSIASGAEKSNVETPTANIRPMAGPSQAKTSQVQQSATIPPTSRSTPLARLRPMSVASRSVAVLTPSQQQQGPPPTSSSSGMSVVQGMQVASSGVETSQQPREEVADSQEEAQGGATVVLVRPQEVSSSQSSQQSLPPPTSSQSTAPTLKRLREDTTTTTRTEEPQLKQGRMEVSSASTVEAEEEPSSSLHEAPDEVIVVDSGDDTEEEEEGERDEEEDDPEDAEVDYPEDEGDENEDQEDGQEEIQDEVEGEEEFPEEMEDEEENVPSPEQQQQEDDDGNEVTVVLDEPPQLPRELAEMIGVPVNEPASSSATHSLDMPEIDEGADEDIVSEDISSPQEVQSEEPPATLAPSQSSETFQLGADSEIVEIVEEGQSSTSQVTTEDAASQMLISLESEDVIPEPEADLPSSSISVPMVIITGESHSQQQQQNQNQPTGGEQIPAIFPRRGMTPRGANRARRSSMRSSGSTRPTPIVWDQSQTPPQQGVGRGLAGTRGNTAARRSRGPRSGHSPFMRPF